MRRLVIDGLGLKLGLTIAALILAGAVATTLVVYREFESHYLELAEEHAAREAALLLGALEHQMMEDERELIRKLVHELPERTRVERVMILDREGVVEFSSDPSIRSSHFDLEDATCQVCHARPAAERDRTALLEVDGGTLLRTVSPIRNEPRCHDCHKPRHRINGVLIVDVPVGATLTDTRQALQRVAFTTAIVALLLLLAISYVVRRLVLLRLRRFEATARSIAHGDLDKRVPVEGNDALSDLERQFNEMADSVSGLLKRLEEQRASLELVMDSADDAMVVLAPDLTIIATNATYADRIAGGAHGVLAGVRCCAPAAGDRPVCTLSDPAGCPARQCFESGEVVTAVHSRTGADGEVRNEEIRASPVRHRDGSISHVVEVWRDITERRRTEAQLAEYHRMASLGMLASGFSHEVNTPLGSIGACLESIGRQLERSPLDAEGRDRIREMADIARTQVERCGTITRQFLDLASGRSLARAVVDLGQDCALVGRLVRRTARAAGVTVVLDPATRVPPVLANRTSVHQVLINLLLNAVAASEAGQEVRIELRCNEAIEVRVADQGRGIPADDLPRLFEPFFTRTTGGTGLGLFVSQGLAHGWGGSIRVVRSDVGEGTTFAVVFPRADLPPSGERGALHDP